MVSASPEAITTLPSCATMLPWFSTPGATRKQKPLSRTTISPRFTTNDGSIPCCCVNALPPCMKLSASMESVVASRPATSTFAPWPNTTPFGFEMNTLPLAVSCPRMVVASPPLMRFNATEDAPGWMNCTSSPGLISKLRQSSTARALPWLMRVEFPLTEIVAEPPETVPLVGAVNAWKG